MLSACLSLCGGGYCWLGQFVTYFETFQWWMAMNARILKFHKYIPLEKIVEPFFHVREHYVKEEL